MVNFNFNFIVVKVNRWVIIKRMLKFAPIASKK